MCMFCNVFFLTQRFEMENCLCVSFFRVLSVGGGEKKEKNNRMNLGNETFFSKERHWNMEEEKGEWLSVTPKDALEDIEMMCEKLLTRKNVMTESLGDEEYKRYVNVFLNLERRRCLHKVLKEATDATRHVNTKSLLEINLLRYLQEQNDDLSNILRSSETGKRIENRLNRRLAGSEKSSKDYDDMQDVMDRFRLCTTPQIFIETIEETFSKGRRLRFASSGVPEFASSLRGGPYHEMENMRTDMCRQIGQCFVLNSQSFTTKTLKQCVLDLSEAMRRVQISTCGEKTVQKGVCVCVILYL